jgi:hypothetical protein
MRIVGRLIRVTTLTRSHYAAVVGVAIQDADMCIVAVVAAQICMSSRQQLIVLLVMSDKTTTGRDSLGITADMALAAQLCAVVYCDVRP